MNQYVFVFSVDGSSRLLEIEVQAGSLAEAETTVDGILSGKYGDKFHLDSVTKCY